MKPKLIIGIDPDIDKCGIAIWDTQLKKLIKCECLHFWDLIEYLYDCYSGTNPQDYLIRIEAGWLNSKSCWHKSQGRGAERIAKNVGENHCIGKLLYSYCKRNMLNSEIINVAGYSQFFIKSEFFKQQTGWMGVTNKDSRAAAAMCWKY